MTTEPILISRDLHVSVYSQTNVPPVKARNGRWVVGKQEILFIEIRAALPGNIRVEPTNAMSFVQFKRPVTVGSGGWSVDNRKAASFQTWVQSLGNHAVELVRAELAKHGVLSLLRNAIANDGITAATGR